MCPIFSRNFFKVHIFKIRSVTYVCISTLESFDILFYMKQKKNACYGKFYVSFNVVGVKINKKVQRAVKHSVLITKKVHNKFSSEQKLNKNNKTEG